MTRREQVTNKVKEIMHESRYNAVPSTLFEMATWADKTLIKRLENWLNDNFGTSYIIDCYGCLTDKTEVTTSFDTMEELMESFHKAMEE